MSASPQAKLFYGYVNPKDEDGNEGWGEMCRYNVSDPCVLEIFGYGDFIRYALAIRVSTVRVEWNDSKVISEKHLIAPDSWNDWLKEHAKGVGIDLAGLEPAWHLVSLYF